MHAQYNKCQLQSLHNTNTTPKLYHHTQKRNNNNSIKNNNHYKKFSNSYFINKRVLDKNIHVPPNQVNLQSQRSTQYREKCLFVSLRHFEYFMDSDECKLTLCVCVYWVCLPGG